MTHRRRVGSFVTFRVVLVFTIGVATLGAQGATFASRVDVVRVDVLAADGGQPIRGLHPDDFDVVDNGVHQTVDFVSVERLPVNVVLALDLSDSVSGEKLGQLRDGGRAVIAAMRPDDRIALITFASVISLRAGLTGDLARVRAALDEPPDALGVDTAVVDASYAAMTLGESGDGRTLSIVLSDGVDTASFLTPRAVLATAAHVNGVVYAVSVRGTGEPTFLHDLAKETGGRVIDVGSSDSLGRTLAAIVAEFRQRYVIGYTPRGVPGAGWHPIAVRVKNRRATVTARPGYFAP